MRFSTPMFGAKKFTLGTITALFLSCFCTSILAGTFTVTPVRVYMMPKDRAVAITITNDGDSQLVMQADIYAWKQNANGDEELTPSEDLFLSPPIIKIAPKSRQVVRLARVKKPQQSNQQVTYRMIVREIPEASPKKDLQVQVALAFSIPVFITPVNAKSILDCKIARLAADKVQAICKNSGNAYSHPVSLSLNTTDGKKIAVQDSGAYILPNITRSFELKSLGGNIPAGKTVLEISLDDGTTQPFEITIDK